VAVTVIDGLVLARSVFEHSANYASLMAFGQFELVGDEEEKLAALRAFTEKLLPGRWEEVRHPSKLELKATAVLRLPLTEASVKVRSGPPDDDHDVDALLDTWAGVVPIQMSFGEPIASPGLRAGIPLSASLRRLVGS
jgi:nitroimidazol reductase NimA-like FMN-containing flavoprotein (pyridoxamine 5'-phosphate oxidase superfamily)